MNEHATASPAGRFMFARGGARIPLPAPLRYPLLLVPATLGASSVATLLLYFVGTADLALGVRTLLLPAVGLLVPLIAWARRTGRAELYDRILAGLWGGVVASLFYDVVRVPISHAGIPVFRAISFFGTVMLDKPAPTVSSDMVGWAYHLSNGVGFGLMYATLFERPRWWTAVAWGVVLELVMLYTPYAEVFGYRRTASFFTITMGAHVAYGLGLWLALGYWTGGQRFGASPRRPPLGLVGTCVLAAVVIAGIAADAATSRSPTTPPSPPAYIGKHLYTTWDVIEPDRVAAMWVFQRFVDPQARFYFVRPFSTTTGARFGTLFDTPEAEIRRTVTESATEILLGRHDLRNDPRLDILARMTHMWEITPWSFAREDKTVLSISFKVVAYRIRCRQPDLGPCIEEAFRVLDAWYEAPTPSTAPYG